MTLYELTEDMIKLQTMLEEMPEDDSISDTIELVEYDLQEKCDGYVKVIRNMEAKKDALRHEEEILGAKRRHLDNSIAKLKKALYEALNVLEKEEINGDLFTIKKRKNPAKLPELTIDEVPDEYLIPQEPKIDRTELLRAVKSGKVEGIELIQGESLMIK